MKIRFPSRSRAAALGSLLLLALPAGAAAQEDSVRVVPGERYRPRGGLHSALLGEGYRDQWTTPIRVPVVDLHAFAGGLTPVETGGHKQTRSLRFRGADGREYNFRSVDKEVTAGLPDFLAETAADWILQDLTSAQLPSAPVVATSLLDRAGVLNPGPRLAVLPDDPALGEFREEFAGMLGTLEVHADENRDDRKEGFAGAVRVAGTDRLLEHLEETPLHRVDARAFLRARLVDALVGDFDRHADQWRWARFDREGLHWWAPVPEDRDYAFVDYDGLLPALARASVAPRLVRFEESYPNPLALLDNSLDLNRRLLAGLSRDAWEEEAASLRAALPDEAIEEAVRAMPPEHFRLAGPGLIRTLKARRDRLPQIAADLYAVLAESVEVRATDEADRAEVERLPGGAVRVRLFADEVLAGGGPYFERTLSPEETEEVRLFLHGGDDRAEVSGGAGPIVVRVIGGGGDDVLEDRSGGHTVLYDARGENRFGPGPGTRVSRREHEEPEEEDGVLPSQRRDWGERRSLFAPALGWRRHAELVVGGGPTWTRFGFRRHPYAWRAGARALYAPFHGRFGLEVEADHRPESSPRSLSLLARAGGLEATPFHGYGNDSPALSVEEVRVWHERYEASALLRLPLSRVLQVEGGGTVRYTESSPPAGSPAARIVPYGTESLGQIGALAALRLRERAERAPVARGTGADLSLAAYPGLWGLDGGYAKADARGTLVREVPRTGGSALALRAGGSAALGKTPFFDAAFLGGRESLRGYHLERFAGDAALFGGVELRVPVTRTELLVRGDLGVSLFADAGRVFVDGESPGGWHEAAGGALWFSTPVGTVSLSYARGEESRVYFRVGEGF